MGFPGETDDEYKTTEDFVKKIGFGEIHVFKYSKRSGTRAAVMEKQIDERIKSERSERLIKVGEELKSVYRQEFVGKTVPVLWEEKVDIQGVEYQVGHTKEYIKVAVVSKEDLSGKISEIKIVDILNQEIMLATL